MIQRRNVAILLFDDVEVLDFAGPFEVFSIMGQRSGPGAFNVYTVAQERRPVLARNKLSVNADFTFEDCPKPDMLIVPGGYGTRALLDDEPTIRWVTQTAEVCELVLSVCTGALVLAKAGLLHGLRATTHHTALGELRDVAPDTEVTGEERFIDNGKFIVAAGVAAGIDASFHVVARLLGNEITAEGAKYIEYPWEPDHAS